MDVEFLSQKTNKEIYARILLSGFDSVNLKIAHDSANYKNIIVKKLGFKNINDEIKLRSCIDLLEDTEMAIIEYYVNGLQASKEMSIKLGERYLRVYGILNAVSLQIDCICEFIELFNIPNKKVEIRRLKNLKIYEIRNKVASHTVSYFNPTTETSVAYRLTQQYLRFNKWGKQLILVPNNGNSGEVNLIKLMDEYSSLSESYLKVICLKAFKTYFQNESNYKRSLAEEFEFAAKRTFDYKKNDESF